MSYEFEWDENKRLLNIQKHKIDFKDVIAVFDDYTVTIEDTRQSYGEQRFITLGILKNNVLVIVHTEKSEKIRIISARKATRQEQRNYYANLQN